MSFQEKIMMLVCICTFLAVIFYGLGQDAALKDMETASAKERLRILCIDRPMDVMCMTVKKEK